MRPTVYDHVKKNQLAMFSRIVLRAVSVLSFLVVTALVIGGFL